MPTEAWPRVSIITPVYNGERYIERCIRSALAQTFSDWEQIVVDDGSTDATAEIVRSFDDPRIDYVALPHRGLGALAATYNTALRRARGELIGILEGDDLWPAEKLARQVPLFARPEVFLSWGRALVIDDADRVVRWWAVPRVARQDLTNAELFRLLTRWNVLPALTVMIRRDALEQIGGFQQIGSSLLVDLPTWLRLAARVPGIARFVDQPLGLYRVHGTNTGVLHNATMRFEHQNIVAAVLNELGDEQLRQLGWSARDARVARASAFLTQGIAHLQHGERAHARTAFAAAMHGTASVREYVIALAGYGSAVLGVDMIGPAQKLRRSAGTLSMRIKERAPSR